MQETDFILQNKGKWEEFEHVLRNDIKDPERLTDLFIETTDDLSFSRTYYPNRSVRVYLNGISQQVYQAIYKNKSRDKSIFQKFWLEDLPEAMWRSRQALLWSFLLFMGGLTVGIVSSIYYPDFAQIILGPSYVEMTEANIAKGDPMAVYKDAEPIDMFFRIAWNNIKIAFGTFVLGILFGIGTIYVVFYNAIMFGAFIYFFIERGLFKESFLAVMLHGTLELSMIVIAGCAGFALAHGLLFPGTYSRGQALIHSARNGIKILIGVTVLLLYAAFIESFATRYTEMPDALRLLIILLSLTIVIGYFVWYPWYRNNKGQIAEAIAEETPKSEPYIFKLNTIKGSGRIFTETFELFARKSRYIALLTLSISIIITLVYGLFVHGKFHQIYETYSALEPIQIIYPWMLFDGHFNFEIYPLAFPLISILLGIFGYLLFNKTDEQLGIPANGLSFTDLLQCIIIATIGLSPLLLPQVFTLFILPVVLPICTLWMYVTFREKKFLIVTFGRTFQLLRGNLLRMMAVFLSTLSVQWLCMLILSSSLIDFLIEFIITNIPRNASYSEESYYILNTFFLFFTPTFLLALSVFGSAILYFSLKEINEANSLLSAIEEIGIKKRAYGLEQEA
jgi:uncharacterized membrane protein SpoIIM required for sporulation